MIAADEVFFKGRLMPLKENCARMQKMTLRDELQNNREGGGGGYVAQSMPSKVPIRWKELLGLPIWATTILFWTVYAQMTTFSVSQATTMDRHITSHFEIPPGSLTVFFVGSILLTVPVYGRFIVRLARRLTGDPHRLTPLQRIGLGVVLSILAMAAAAVTEIKRLHVATQDPATLAGEATMPLTVFYLVPQFLLVGAGEAFTYIGQLDFFLRKCPRGMKTKSTGLFLSTLALGFFLSLALVTVVH